MNEQKLRAAKEMVQELMSSPKNSWTLESALTRVGRGLRLTREEIQNLRGALEPPPPKKGPTPIHECLDL